MDGKVEKQVLYRPEKHHPKTVKIVDADWNSDYGLALILETGQQSWIELNGVELKLPEFNNLFGIRWIGSSSLLVSAFLDRSSSLKQLVLTTEGKVLGTMRAGELVADQLANEDGIWFSYYDEGIFGGGIASEGLILKDLAGKTLFRYHSDLLDRPDIDDCYAICKGKGRELWLFPYSSFQLLAIDPKTRGLWSFDVPRTVHGASGICVRGRYAYFYDPYDSNGKLYQLKIGTRQLELLGEGEGRLRGMRPSERAHFLSIGDSAVTLYRILNNEEYHD